MLSQIIGGSTFEILNLLLSIPCIMLALSFHEAAHGYVAYKMGDPTARNLGRLTLNPIKHLDLIGSLFMLMFGYGWAKPVPINTRYFKKQKQGMALTALAGPAINLILGILGTILYRIALAGFSNDAMLSLCIKNDTVYALCTAVLTLINCFCFYNLSYAVFNLIPIPPFDGSRVLFAFLPDKYYFGIMKYERYIMIALLVFLSVGSGFSIGTIVNGIFGAINRLLDFIPFLAV